METVFAISVFLVFFFLALGFFTYIYPYTVLQRDVHVLGTVAARQGGLTQEDIDQFQERLARYPFLGRSDQVQVSVYVNGSLQDPASVTPLGEEGGHYVTRESKDLMDIEVRVPASGTLLRAVAKFFGVEGVSDEYVFWETVVSYRN
ncbi:hypothetical protein GsuE55_37850 (plasmid) [Geobacillus subterraneus]|uniref:Uncharacterized protein n=1 Tax=Geobacillus subterraneus TaxID=129338 RepID=A0A679FQM1_9BACL|nr:hypothetical protein GsuE55_37850 [Geobacillus subterraneus]